MFIATPASCNQHPEGGTLMEAYLTKSGLMVFGAACLARS